MGRYITAAMMLTCEECKRKNEQFSIPYDQHGVAIMEAHFEEKHPGHKLLKKPREIDSVEDITRIY